jgi:acrylyl-CoA reductase (NADPH)
VRAWIAESNESRGGWREIEPASVPAKPVTVRVTHSALNFKDALALTGRSPIFRRFPMVPGIDIVGEILADESGRFQAGELVVATGHGLGEIHWGGYAEQARLEPEWLVRLPKGIAPADAASIGTAGLTAALSVLALEDYGIAPDKGPVLVTGASGGVGGHAIALLQKAGFAVTAVTGRPAEADYLCALGASDVIARSEFEGDPRPIAKERWAAAVDVAGGRILANVLSQIRYGGAVAASGLAQSMNLPTSVAPFILRAVSLLGIDSVAASAEKRERSWARLARDLDFERLRSMTTLHRFEEVDALAEALLDQKLRGRAVLHWG